LKASSLVRRGMPAHSPIEPFGTPGYKVWR
jgi:hypothetical protein